MNAVDVHTAAYAGRAADLQLNAVSSAAIPPPFQGGGEGEGRIFEAHLGAAVPPTSQPASSNEEEVVQQARDAATQFVATAFIMPVLAMMHDSPFATEPFAPNSAQKRFMPMLDWQIADRVTTSANFPLVDRIVEQMTQHQPAAHATGVVDVHG